MRSVLLDKPNKSSKNNDDMEEDDEIETLLEEALDTMENRQLKNSKLVLIVKSIPHFSFFLGCIFEMMTITIQQYCL